MRDSKGQSPVQIRWIDQEGVGLVFFDAAPWEMRVAWAVAPAPAPEPVSRARQAEIASKMEFRLCSPEQVALMIEFGYLQRG